MEARDTEACESLRELTRRIFAKYRDFTMIPESIYAKNLRIAERLRSVEGCIVECGVWRGGMMAGIAELLGPNRDYFLFDSFEGLPPAQAIDGPHAIAWQADTEGPIYYDNCTAPIESAQTAMRMSGVDRVTIMKGWFQDTLPSFTPPGPIALLRLDGDWYESTLACLNSLFRYVSQDGFIIVDDYYAWDGCSRALHEFLAREPSNRRIQQFDNEVCVVTPYRFWFEQAT
jgi:O-methyltransferase